MNEKLAINVINGLIYADVHAHTFPSECYFDGILGMNILGGYNFSVDFDTGILELTARVV